MEKPVEQQLSQLMNTPGVVGAICVDKRGLCLGAQGNATSKASGVIMSIAQHASKLQPTAASSPVISIESDNGSILIKSHDDITMAVYKATS